MPTATERLLKTIRRQVMTRDFVSARQSCRNLARHVPDHVEGWVALAQCEWRCGDYLAAVQCFERAYQLHPDPGNAVRLIQAYISTGQLESATFLAERSSSRWPESPMLWTYTALAALQRRQTNRVLDQLQRGITGPGAIRSLLGLHVVRNRWNIPPLDPLPTEFQSERDRALADSARFSVEQGQASLCAYSPQVLLSAAEAAPTTGLVVECGVYWGRSLRMLADSMDRPIHGFDSFEGLPEDWTKGEHRGSYSTAGRLPELPPQVTLHPGWFNDTLPGFVAAQDQPLALLHVDCDLYSSTITVLEAFRPLFRNGTIVVFDDYIGFPGWQDHEFRAWNEFCAKHQLDHTVISTAFLGREVAIRISG